VIVTSVVVAFMIMVVLFGGGRGCFRRREIIFCCFCGIQSVAFQIVWAGLDLCWERVCAPPAAGLCLIKDTTRAGSRE
jgi:hypothetical protein